MFPLLIWSIYYWSIRVRFSSCRALNWTCWLIILLVVPNKTEPSLMLFVTPVRCYEKSKYYTDTHTEHHTAIHSGLFDWLPWITDVAWLFILPRNRWLNFWEEIFQQLQLVRPRCLCSLITNHTLKKRLERSPWLTVCLSHEFCNPQNWWDGVCGTSWAFYLSLCVWTCASLWLYCYWYHLYFNCFIQVCVWARSALDQTKYAIAWL